MACPDRELREWEVTQAVKRWTDLEDKAAAAIRDGDPDSNEYLAQASQAGVAAKQAQTTLEDHDVIVHRCNLVAPNPAAEESAVKPKAQARVFPGGGRVTIVQIGRSGPTTFEVAWRNPSSAQLKEAQAFWKSVNGHIDAFWFNFDGTRYEPCHFEPDSLKRMPTRSDRSDCLVVRFVGTKVAGDWALKPVPPDQKGE
jgi:hypothetical protein